MAERSGEASPSDAATSPQHEESQSGNWWDSWLSSAKNKSAEVYSMVKKDLDEIGSAVKSEATHVFSTTSNVIGKTFKLDVPESPANVMKKSFSSFIGQVSTVLNPEPDDEDDTEVILSSGDTTMLSTYKKELEALQRVDATFIVPAYSPEFEAWRGSLEGGEGEVIAPAAAARRLDSSPLLKAQYRKLVPDAVTHDDFWERLEPSPLFPAWRGSLEGGEGEVIAPAAAARRLDSSPLLKAQYRKLVPDAVTHDDFWERYLFRVALLQDRLAAASRKQPVETPTTDPVLAHLPLQTVVAPIEQSPKKVLSGIEAETPFETPDIDNVTWEDEDFANDVELTEEQQTLLLEEYEKEITSKKVTKKPARDATNNNADGNDAQTTDKINKTTDKNKNIDKKNGRSPKKVKADDCGNLVEDYFGDKEVKDDASANSDESWEKEFELEDVEQKA